MPINLFADAAGHAAKTPVFVLTGFLGSGKTTLLNRLLRLPALADTAVIVNELGDVALDHLLVESISGEVALLKSGCVCCAVRSDFEQTLRELLARRDDGTLPPFVRVVVETTGLADPAPLVQAVDTEPLLAHWCRLGAVLTTLDAVNAPRQLDAQWEARKQVALADRVLVTKTDLAPLDAAVVQRIAALNPHAPVHTVTADAPIADWLVPRPVDADVARAAGWLGARPLGAPHGDVRSDVLEAHTPLVWARLQQWLAELRARDGERLLRLKGVVRVDADPAPLLLHGVHHLFHPPLAAPALDWPAARSVVVLIGRGLDVDALRRGFAACAAAAG